MSDASPSPLAGGRTSGDPVRVGNTVHRPVRPWTTTVHAVLRHLERAGFDGAPRVLGVEGEREVLTFLEGETVGDRLPWPAWVWADATVQQVGVWLRRLHDATADFVPPDDAVWLAGQAWRPGLVIGHHDAAPYNAVWRRGRLAGFVDWDTAGPSSRELDLAWSALMWVPLLADGSAWPVPAGTAKGRSRRLHLLLDAYGFAGDRSEFGSVVAARARLNARVTRALAEKGDPVYVALLGQADDLDRSAAELERLAARFWRPEAAERSVRYRPPGPTGGSSARRRQG